MKISKLRNYSNIKKQTYLTPCIDRGNIMVVKGTENEPCNWIILYHKTSTDSPINPLTYMIDKVNADLWEGLANTSHQENQHFSSNLMWLNERWNDQITQSKLKHPR